MKRNILTVILILSAIFCAYGQNTSPIDLVLLLDTSSGMSSSYENVNNYITGAFLNEFLRIGDTFHLIAFSANPRLDAARRISGIGDVETIIGRMLIQYPVENGNNITAALTYIEQYITSLPSRQKKIVLITSGSSDTNNLVNASKQRLNSRNTTLDYIQVIPGSPLSNLPSSGRPAVARTTTTAAPTTVAATPTTSTAVTGRPSAETSTQTIVTTPGTVAGTSTASGTNVTAGTSTASGVSTTTGANTAPGTSTTAGANTASGTSTASGIGTATGANTASGTGTATGANTTSGTSTTAGTNTTSGTSSSAASGVTAVTETGSGQVSSSDSSASQASKTKSSKKDSSVSKTSDKSASASSASNRKKDRNESFSVSLPFILFIIIFILLILGLIIYFASRKLGSSPNRIIAEVASYGSKDKLKTVDHNKDLANYAADKPKTVDHNKDLANYAADKPKTVDHNKNLANYAADNKPKTVDHNKDLTNYAADKPKTVDHNKDLANYAADKPKTVDHNKDLANYAADKPKTVDHNKDLANYAAVQSRRSTPYENRPLKTEKYKQPVINPAGPLLLNLFVEDQNTAIGKRNIHSLKSGYSLSVGGEKSDDYLIFLVPMPAHLGEIRRNGSTLTFIPKKPKYFPDIGSNEVKDCINKTIRITSDKNYEMCFRFEMYEDPLIALNRTLLSVKVPG